MVQATCSSKMTGFTQTTKQQDPQNQTVRSHSCPVQAALSILHQFCFFCHDSPSFCLYFCLLPKYGGSSVGPELHLRGTALANYLQIVPRLSTSSALSALPAPIPSSQHPAQIRSSDSTATAHVPLNSLYISAALFHMPITNIQVTAISSVNIFSFSFQVP
jgi:hypothetical protein